jgi:hypothetical protein
VKRSIDKNIGINDHTWENQVKHTAAYSGISNPPLEAGFKSPKPFRLARRPTGNGPAKKQQLFSLDDFDSGRVSFPETNTDSRTPPTGHFTARNGDAPEWPASAIAAVASAASAHLRSMPASTVGL